MGKDTYFQAYSLLYEAAITFENAWDVDSAPLFQKTLDLCSKARSINPDLVQAYAMEGLSLIKLMRFEEAVGPLEKAVEMASETEPRNAFLYTGLGLSYFLLDDFDKAVNASTRSIELDPEKKSPYQVRGTALIMLERYDEAVADFTKVIEMNPEFSSAYQSRGTAYTLLKRLDDALGDMERLIELAPCASSYVSRANIFSKLGRFDDALADLKTAIALEPDSTGAYCSLGLTLHAMGKTDEAKECYQRILETIGKKDINERTELDYLDAIFAEEKLKKLNPDIELEHDFMKEVTERYGSPEANQEKI